MQMILIVVLTLAYILVAYIGPVAALGVSLWWAWGHGASDEGSIAGAFAIFVLCATVLLVAVKFAKRAVKWAMNQVDIEEETPEAVNGDRS